MYVWQIIRAAGQVSSELWPAKLQWTLANPNSLGPESIQISEIINITNRFDEYHYQYCTVCVVMEAVLL